MLLDVLQQRAACPMDDAFRRAGRPGRIEDVERLIERPSLELEIGRCVAHPVFPSDGAGNGRTARIVKTLDDHVFHGWQRCGHGGGLLQAIESLATVGIAVHRQQQPRRDLAEPIEDALHAEIRRAGGPDGADGRGAQRGHDGLRGVRRNGGDAIAGDDPEARNALAARPTASLSSSCDSVTSRPDSVLLKIAGRRPGAAADFP
jgi:hypothetical protein